MTFPVHFCDEFHCSAAEVEAYNIDHKKFEADQEAKFAKLGLKVVGYIITNDDNTGEVGEIVVRTEPLDAEAYEGETISVRDAPRGK